MSMLSVQSVRQPAVQPAADPARHPHLHPVPQQVTRRRPRLVHGVVGLAGLGVIMLVQLGLSLFLSDGAYQLSALQTQSSELARTQQSLNEQLDVLASPQDLGLAAQELGMVQGQASPFIQLSTGSVIGGADALHLDASVNGKQGLNVPNALVTRDEAAAQAAAEAAIAAAAGDTVDAETEPYPGMVLPGNGESNQ